MAALVTTVVGSYPQPDWLIDRERLGERLPPRVRARELWRVPEPLLEEAQDDATRLAVADMERAGVDVITDGEMRRESYSNRFATALEGVDLDEPGRRARPHGPREPRAEGRRPGPPHPAGRGPRRRVPALDHRAPHQDHRARAVHDDAPGPERPLRRRPQPRARVRGGRERGAPRPEGGRSRHRPDRRALPAGATRSRRASTPLEAIDRALDGIDGETVLHTCFGYAHIVKDRLDGYPFLRELGDCRATHLSLEAAQPDLDPELLRDLGDKTIVLGVLDLGAEEVETPEVVAGRIRSGARRSCRRSGSSSAPDCGMKYLPRERAFRKLEAMVAGARLVADDLGL